MSEQHKRLSIVQIIGSVLSSFFGVQKNATRERDFILVGVLLTVVFILIVWGVVQLVMSVAVTQ